MQTITNIIHNSIFKRFLILLLLLLLFITISAVSYVNAISTNISENLFRLHVIANSNTQEDQDLKYLVRDNILDYINTLSENLHSKDEVINLAMQNMEEIKKIAEETIVTNGYDYNVNISIGNFDFPTKHYGDISLPAGKYDALKVEIGETRAEKIGGV